LSHAHTGYFVSSMQGFIQQEGESFEVGEESDDSEDVGEEGDSPQSLTFI
jgi:hypothetical protein